MHTGYYFGFFLAALANYFIGANFGWRWMFVLGGTPALLVGWIQSGVHEPQAWQKKAASQKERPRMIDAFNALFTLEYRARTVVNSLLFTEAQMVNAAAKALRDVQAALAVKEGHTAQAAVRIASYAGGCWRLPPSSDACGAEAG
jgi:MFS family permease